MSADIPTGVEIPTAVEVPADGDETGAEALARHHHDSADLGPAVEAREVEAEDLSLDAIDAVTMSGLALVDDVVDDDDLVDDPGDELDDEVDAPDDDPGDQAGNRDAVVDEGGGSP